MTFARCKCGKIKVWSSGMPSPACTPCPSCNTVPASGPDCHPDVVPHDFFVTSVETDEGPKPLSVCRLCNKTRGALALEAIRVSKPLYDPEKPV